MTRKRLRSAHSTEGLSTFYGHPYNHREWQDHRLRIAVTLEVAQWAARLGGLTSGADLSAGDGSVLSGVRLTRKVFGDISGQWDVSGWIEETLPDLVPVDLYICTETLEHLDDPDLILKTIRQKAKVLVLSTPVDAFEDTNPEHYWAWSKADVEAMLNQAGFQVFTYVSVNLRALGPEYYEFGIWVCQ
jgi:hypothetical protein